MKYHRWLVGCLLLGNLHAAGQHLFVPDTVRVDELKRNFYSWVEAADSTLLDCPDRAVTHMTGVSLLYISDSDGPRRTFYLDSDSIERLHRAGGETLPASCWAYSVPGKKTSADVRDHFIPTLYWHGLHAPIPGGLDSVALRRRLVERYGEDPVYGVPARWFSGAVYNISKHYFYCNNRICMHANRKTVVNGACVRSDRMEGKAGSLARAQQDMLISSTEWHMSTLFGRIELEMLSCNLYGLVPRDSSYTGSQDFALLLYVDASGKACFHPLLPDALTAGEQRCLDRLNRAMALQPRWQFGYMLTTDGRIFPARYLRAAYRPETGVWRFDDYLFDRAFTPLSVPFEGHFEREKKSFPSSKQKFLYW